MDTEHVLVYWNDGTAVIGGCGLQMRKKIEVGHKDGDVRQVHVIEKPKEPPESPKKQESSQEGALKLILPHDE